MHGGTVPAVSSIRVAEANLQSKDPGLKTKRTELWIYETSSFE